MYSPDNPLIVQSDKTILLETASPRFEEARDCLSSFAELLKSPEHIHTYRVSPLSLWNAAALGFTPEAIKDALSGMAKYPVPDNVLADVDDYMSRYGRIQLVEEDGQLLLVSEDEVLLREVCGQRAVQPLIVAMEGPGRVVVQPDQRGFVKQALIKVGFPVEDLAGYKEGAGLDVGVRGGTDVSFVQLRRSCERRGQPHCLRRVVLPPRQQPRIDIRYER